MIQRIDSINDPRIAPYRHLKDRDLASTTDLFIAEGELVVRRLLASALRTHSVFLSERRAEEIAPLAPDDVPVYIAHHELMHDIVGFKFHSGVLAAGQRPARLRIEDVAPQSASRLTLLICPELANTENLGAMIRIGAAFGIDAMVLGERSCDPFFRQSVRVSMGTVFSVRIVQSQDLLRDLEWLKREREVELIATVLDETAERLASVKRSSRAAILFGNEAQGLDELTLAMCDRRVTIPMQLGTDSLNVAVAAGIVMYHFSR